MFAGIDSVNSVGISCLTLCFVFILFVWGVISMVVIGYLCWLLGFVWVWICFWLFVVGYSVLWFTG